MSERPASKSLGEQRDRSPALQSQTLRFLERNEEMGTADTVVGNAPVDLDVIDRRFTRRRIAGLALGGALVASAGLRLPAAAQEVESASFNVRTTAAVNFQSGPGATNSALLLVVPVGATVSGTGRGSAGCLGVTYNGVSG